MTKIIINAKVLQQMLADQPEISIELAKNAADQVAEAFKKKVDTAAMVARMVTNLEEQLSYRRSPFSKIVSEIIRREALVIVNSILLDQSGNLIKEAVRKAMEDHKVWINHNLNSIIIDNVNRAMRAAQEAAIKGALR